MSKNKKTNDAKENHSPMLLPLHDSIRSYQSTETFMKLIHQYPHQVHLKDEKNRLPLHLACRSEHSSESEVINMLLSMYPEAVQVIDDYKQLPLQYACNNFYCSESNIKKLVRLYPDALRYPDNRDNFPINLLLDNDDQSDDIIMFLIDHYPTWIHKIDYFGDYPLHKAVRSTKTSVGLVTKLIETYPETTRHANHAGNYPLHLACWLGDCCITSILQLIDTYPDAAHKQNIYHEYPLHIYFDSRLNNFPIDFDNQAINPYNNIGMKLISLCPKALTQRNNRGRTPFHVACDMGNWTMVKMVSTASLRSFLPEIHISGVDSWGNTPLHLASTSCVVRMDCLTLLQFLLNHPLLIVNQRNDSGQLPSDWVRKMVGPKCRYSNRKKEAKKIVTLLENLDIERRIMAYRYSMAISMRACQIQSRNFSPRRDNFHLIRNMSIFPFQEKRFYCTATSFTTMLNSHKTKYVLLHNYATSI
jgi:ankyrin repeat protein